VLSLLRIGSLTRVPLGLVAALCMATACGSASPITGDVASPSRTASTTPTSSCPGVAPSSRAGASVAYDAGRRVTVLFGGFSAASKQTLDETWLFDGRCWQQARFASKPGPRVHAGMAYHPLVGRTVLIGGRSETPNLDYPYDAWSWDGAGWTRLTGAPQLASSVASYDQARQVVVVFGWGLAGVPETWTWDGITWARKSSPQSPSTYAQSAMCFDRSTLNVLLYGGVSHNVSGGVSSDMWLWDGSAWSQLKPVNSPGPRFELILLCGPQTVLYGGLTDQYGKLGSGTWVWNGSDWRQIPSMHTPTDCCGAAFYDGSRQMVIETGRDGIPIWSWTGADWAS
jgi:hypothetical protein